MLQIAEGMNYLHGMGLVHRDLKPANIFMKCDNPPSESPVSAPLAESFWIAKISGFSDSKVKQESTAYGNQTLNIGTYMFMAPEVYELEHGEKEPEIFHPKKTDVYSFGLLCLAVLIGDPTPFPFPTDKMWNPSVRAFKDRVKKGKRPELPPNCPDRLSILIQRCWDGSPLNRPNFQDICTELRYIKGLLLTGMIISPPHHVDSNESSVSGDDYYPYHNSLFNTE
jgi:serine/threonine protein kinase